MATYILVNSVFVALVIGFLSVPFKKPSRAAILALAILVVLTAVFDSLIIYFGIVGYDTTKILGIFIGRAPIEDFFYAVLALLIVVTVWHRLGGTHAPKD